MNWKINKYLFFTFLLIVGIGLPLFPALAYGEWLATLIAWRLIAIPMTIMILVSGIFMNLSVAILNWVTGPSFITLSGGITGNQFVLTGWEVVRDLTNVIFVLVLAVIGLATSLRIEEYKAKKTLPLLIIVALLINFTPVITGFIIDGTNIVMNFFLSGIRGFAGLSSMGATLNQAASNLVGAITSVTKSTNENMSSMLNGLSIIAFNSLGGFIILLFAFLFMVRYLALWILVILSPIAFFSYILPSTRGIWKQWWNQFVQWSIIGIPAAFFLYLTEIMLKIGTKGMIAPSNIEGFNIMNFIIPYDLPIFLLIIGFYVAISTSASGASFITSQAKKSGIWARKQGYKKTIQGSRWAEKGISKGFSGGLRTARKMKKEGVRKTIGEGWSYARREGTKIKDEGAKEIIGKGARKGWALGKMAKGQIKWPGPSELDEKLEMDQDIAKYAKFYKKAVKDNYEEILKIAKTSLDKKKREAAKIAILSANPSKASEFGKDRKSVV